MHISANGSRIALVLVVVAAAVVVRLAMRSADEPDTVPAPPVAHARPAAVAPLMTVDADASDLPRGLLRATTSWEVRPGRIWLRFPRWIQGTHAPCGAIENLGGLVIRADAGDPLPWSRDPLDVYRFAVVVPAGCGRISVAITYLANQPTTNSLPVDALEIAGVGTVNWNDCLLYPEGWSSEQLRVAASLRLPALWRQACALDGTPAEDGTVTYEPTNLRGLLDAPVLCGRNLQIHELAVEHFAPHRLAVASPQALSAPPERALEQMRGIAAEARELCGGAPFSRYTWLLGLGDNFPHLGLEHLACSLDGISEDSWFDDDGISSGAAFLLSHEYGHAWCGKHHRPVGMLTSDCQTNLDTRLLWVYEGFDQYVGMILAARSGAVDRETWFSHLGSQIESVSANRSRAWRTLEDTAAAGYTLRGQSRNWNELRGAQDYYLEGMLLCFEADGLIRRASKGSRSFDDVLRIFLAPQPGTAAVPFTEADVVAALHAVEPSIDWPALIDRLVRRTIAKVDLAALSTWGMQANWDNARPSAKLAEQGYLDDRWSIGLVLWRGQISDVQPGSPADTARLATGERILKVNDVALSPAVWDRALRTSSTSNGIRLHVRARDGTERDVQVACTSGPRYLHIVPSTDPAGHAILEAILAPRSTEGRAVRAAGGGW